MVKAFSAWAISGAMLVFVVSAAGQDPVPADTAPRTTPAVSNPVTQPAPQLATPQVPPISPPISTVPPPVSPSVTPVPAAEACVGKEGITLLQRMDELLTRTKDDDGHSLKQAGVVSIDRANLDEVKAEIAQLKAMLAK
jgi:hypothetical protein